MKQIGLLLAFAIFTAAFLHDSNAQDWDAGGDGISWDDALNWTSNNEPTLGTLARINAVGGANVVITQAGEVADRYILGQGNAGNNMLTISSGSLTTDSGTAHRIGQISQATLTVNGGSLTVQNGLQTIGVSTGGDGTLNVNGGVVNFGNGVNVGSATGMGAINVNGSTADFNITNNLLLLDNSSVSFTADAAGVTDIDLSGELDINPNTVLTIDLTNFANSGSDIVLFDYGTLDATNNTFTTVNLINGTGTIDHAFDLGGGDLAVVLTNAVAIPEPTAFLMVLLSAIYLSVFRRKLRLIS